MTDINQATPWAVLRNIEGPKKEKYQIDLQLFADTPADPPSDPPRDPLAEPELPKTAEELHKLLQAEADKRVTQALQTAQSKWEADLDSKIKAAKDEADKLAKLNAQDKEKYLLDKKEAELKKLQADIELKQLTIDAARYLDENKISTKFLDYLLPGCESLDGFARKADAFKASFDEAVAATVELKLKGSTQPWNTGGGVNSNSIGKQMAEVTKKNTSDGETIRNQYFK